MLILPALAIVTLSVVVLLVYRLVNLDGHVSIYSGWETWMGIAPTPIAVWVRIGALNLRRNALQP